MSENVDTAIEGTDLPLPPSAPPPRPPHDNPLIPPNEDPHEMMMASIASKLFCVYCGSDKN